MEKRTNGQRTRRLKPYTFRHTPTCKRRRSEAQSLLQNLLTWSPMKSRRSNRMTITLHRHFPQSYLRKLKRTTRSVMEELSLAMKTETVRWETICEANRTPQNMPCRARERSRLIGRPLSNREAIHSRYGDGTLSSGVQARSYNSDNKAPP